MTMTTFYTVVCSCGHQGKIKLRENDTPYQIENFEHYTLIDLKAGKNTVPNGGLETIFQQMGIRCPKCNSALTLDNLKL